MKLPFTLATAILLSLTFLNIASYLSISHVLTNQRVLGASIEKVTPSPQLLLEEQYWKKVVHDNPTYLDGYLKLAIIEKQIGNVEASNKYLDVAKNIDPNSSKVLDISTQLK